MVYHRLGYRPKSYYRKDLHGMNRYHQSSIIRGLCKHESRLLVFTLVIDHFWLKYVNTEDAEHLMPALKQNYEVTEDWEGERYSGMHLHWDYSERKVHLAMSGYVEKTPREFLHEQPRRKQYSPFPCAQKKHCKESHMIHIR